MIGDDRDIKNDMERLLYPEEPVANVFEPPLEGNSLYIPPVDQNNDMNHIFRETITPSETVSDGNNDCRANMSFNLAAEQSALEVNDTLGEQEFETTFSIVSDLTELISEFDMTKKNLKNDEAIEIISFCQNRIIECISNHCGNLISDDTLFSNDRHTPSPFEIVQNGRKIRKVLRPGIIVKNKVLLKAIVQLEIDMGP